MPNLFCQYINRYFYLIILYLKCSDLYYVWYILYKTFMRWRNDNTTIIYATHIESIFINEFQKHPHMILMDLDMTFKHLIIIGVNIMHLVLLRVAHCWIDIFATLCVEIKWQFYTWVILYILEHGKIVLLRIYMSVSSMCMAGKITLLTSLHVPSLLLYMFVYPETKLIEIQ